MEWRLFGDNLLGHATRIPQPRRIFFVEAKADCPFCGSVKTIKRGGGRRKCKECGRTYGPSSGTVMSSAKLSPAKLTLMINMMVNDCKLKAICDAVGISTRTAYVWRMKIYSVAFELQKSVILSGIVTIDEKLIPVNKGIAYEPKDGKKLRGVSRNQVIVACGVDEHGQRIAVVAGRGHITSRQCLETYGKHIAGISLVVHDGLYSHRAFIDALGLSEEVHVSTESGAHRALQPVNAFHSEISHWIEVHRGLRTEYLPINLAWVAFRSSIRCGKMGYLVAKLVALCFQTNVEFKVKDRYSL